MTKISIVTVCYNSAGTIRRTLESVRAQHYKDLEYIVIDGGSTDGTVDILKEYEDVITDWSSEPDGGIYDAMNKGIKKSSGDLITFLNSDDWYEEDVLGDVAKCFEDTQTDIIYGNFIMQDGEDRQYVYELDNINLEELHYKWLLCHQALFYKRTLFEVWGGYDTSYKAAADYEWTLRAYVNGVKFEHLPRMVCRFSIGGFSVIHEEDSIEELRRLQINLLPEQLKEKYLPRIIENYQTSMRDYLARCIMSGIVSGNKKTKQKMQQKLKLIYDNSRIKLIVWGAGQRGKRYVNFLNASSINIFAVMDNNVSLWGQKLEGITICKPYRADDKNVIILIAVRDDSEEVKKQLVEMGYTEDHIVMNYLEFIKLLLMREEERNEDTDGNRSNV